MIHAPTPTSPRQRRRLRAVLAASALLGACAAPPAPQPAPPLAPAADTRPEAASGFVARPLQRFERQAVAAANPLAAEAGAEMLRAGGSALDAAVAAQLVLGLVEPQSSGIGGGAFLLHTDGRSVTAWDGRETAPAAARDDQFLGPAGVPLPQAQAVRGGRAVATPGVLPMLHAAHRRHGVLPWARLFEPARRIAEQGFAVTPRLHTLLQGDPSLRDDPLARAFYYRADGSPHPVGHVLRNPAMAQLLRELAERGPAALHAGRAAADIEARVKAGPAPGPLTQADLAAYAAREREPICTVWRLRWRVCGMPPPSSGHLAVMQVLLLLDAVAPQARLDEADGLHAYTEAARLAFADRGLHVADPDFVAAPGGRWDTLLAPGYLAARARLIGPQRRADMPAGQPGAPAPLAWAPMPEQPERGTSHLSVVDAAGRAVAMTTSIEQQFGARVMSDGGTGLPGGFLLNNTMTDFALAPRDAGGRAVANRIEPGKRPRSSMSPTLVFDARSGELLMTLGSPGGAGIIHFVARTLRATLVDGADPQAAIAAPNLATTGGPLLLERGRFAPALREALAARGHAVQETELTSGLQAIQRHGGGWRAGADPRREGAARGD